ncbi:MAG TPA: hypothetical protein VGE66_18235 [Chitinophagaceae bacterium]
MKKVKFLSLFAAALSLGMVACNSDGDNTAEADSLTTTESTATTTAVSTGDYAAQADSARINSEAGNYLDARTGKPIRITVDPQTGARTNAETGEPVWRYVDRRNWWVYGGDNWDTVGEARMQNDKIEYKGDNDAWVTYDKRWVDEDAKMAEEWKKKYGETKVKVSKDGDIKVKDESGDIKYDADDNKIKTDVEKKKDNK